MNRIKRSLLNALHGFCLLLLSSCGYRFGQGELAERYPTISVPYVVGDLEGEITGEIIKQLIATHAFEYRNCDGALTLYVVIQEYHDDNIGFRYDQNKKGELRDYIIPVETRTSVVAEIQLVDSATGCVILGPVLIKAIVDFDHDYYSSKKGINVFSLGQLTDIDTAEEIVQHPLNRVLAVKIVEYIRNSW
jgi:hypothetical protein